MHQTCSGRSLKDEFSRRRLKNWRGKTGILAFEWPGVKMKIQHCKAVLRSILPPHLQIVCKIPKTTLIWMIYLPSIDSTHVQSPFCLQNLDQRDSRFKICNLQSAICILAQICEREEYFATWDNFSGHDGLGVASCCLMLVILD